MKPPRQRLFSNRLYLTGEVVEILSSGGKQAAKILLKSCSIEIPTDQHPDLHLGDCVEIVAETRTRTVVPCAARKVGKTKP